MLRIEGENYTDTNQPKIIRNPGQTEFGYDVNGHIAKATDYGNPNDSTSGRDFYYLTDADGQVMTRDEYLAGDTPGAGNKYSWHKYFYAAGRRIGNLGNNGAETLDYAAELRMRESSLDAALRAQKQAAAGSSGADNDSRFKRFTPSSSVDFDENYQPINSSYPGGAPGSYSAKDGDTLQSIACNLWGDQTLWYLLAEANGLSQAASPLTAGTSVVVPNKVANFHNNAFTLKPYDAGRAIGDTSPTLRSLRGATSGISTSVASTRIHCGKCAFERPWSMQRIISNPVRAGISKHPCDYRRSGHRANAARYLRFSCGK